MHFRPGRQGFLIEQDVVYDRFLVRYAFEGWVTVVLADSSHGFSKSMILLAKLAHFGLNMSLGAGRHLGLGSCKVSILGLVGSVFCWCGSLD